jgi:hypothetical protein
MDQAVEYIVDQRNLKSLKDKSYGIEEFLDELNNQKTSLEILDYKLDRKMKRPFSPL